MTGPEQRAEPARCPACGRPVTPALGSCGACGGPLADVAPGPRATPEETVAAPVPIPSGRRTGHRRWWIGGGIAAAVAAGATVVVLLVAGGGGGGDRPSSPADQRSRDARDVAAALSRLSDDPSSLRAGTRALADTDPRQAVPDGTTVTADESSWQPDGAGGGLMTVTLTAPDGTAMSYLAVVVREGDSWKVLQTVSAPASTPSPSAVAS